MRGSGSATGITPRWPRFFAARGVSAARHSSYDVVIVGGAVMGSAVAWNLACASDFTGRILVVERDVSYEFAATARSNSCMRQQFSSAVNIRISQYGAEFVREFREQSGEYFRVRLCRTHNPLPHNLCTVFA